MKISEVTHPLNRLKPRSPTWVFLRLVDKLRTDPYKPEYGVGRDYEFGSVDVVFNLRAVNENTIILQSFRSNNPRTGEGTQALAMLCKWADQAQVILALDAGPYSTNNISQPMNRETLMSWYGRFGFIPTGRTVGDMVRQPR